MRWWGYALIGLGVAAAHVAAFAAFSGFRPMAWLRDSGATPRNFNVRERVVVSGTAGERWVEREITVSTQMPKPPPRPAE